MSRLVLIYFHAIIQTSVCRNGEKQMGMTASAIRFYTDSERVAFQKIDGMNEVMNAKPSDFQEVSASCPP